MSKRPQQSRVDSPSAEDLRQIIQGDPVASAQLTVEWGERLGKSLESAGLTSSQIRNVFAQVRRIEMSWPPPRQSQPEQDQMQYSELIRLKPKIVYQAAKAKEAAKAKGGVEYLVEVLLPAIDLVEGNRLYFQRFADFFESILAYHHKAAQENRR